MSTRQFIILVKSAPGVERKEPFLQSAAISENFREMMDLSEDFRNMEGQLSHGGDCKG